MDNHGNIRSLSIALRAKRKALGLTQTALSEMSGVSFRTVQSIESGKASFSVKNLCLIADALGLELTLGVKKLNL